MILFATKDESHLDPNQHKLSRVMNFLLFQLSTYVSSRLPCFHEDPLTFDPERFHPNSSRRQVFVLMFKRPCAEANANGSCIIFPSTFCVVSAGRRCTAIFPLSWGLEIASAKSLPRYVHLLRLGRSTK